MESASKNPIVVASTVIGLSLLLSVALGAAAFAKSKTLGNTMMVTGSSEKVVDSDTVKWSIWLSATGAPSERASVGRALNADRASFMKLLGTIGIDEASVSIQPMSINPDYTYNNQTGASTLTGYTASQVLVVESSKVDEVGKLAESAAGTLAEQGVNMSTNSLEYYYNKLADVKLELLTAATENARDRAEAIITGGGGHLGAVRSADTGVFQVTGVNSADLSDYGTYDTSSPKKKVTAVVHISFGLK